MVKALAGEDLEVYDNKIDRFCYVGDMIDDIVRFMDSNKYGIQELGHPYEISILELAKLIVTITNSRSKIVVV
jgi:nucleoside-diphosphate-sugar epimerase